MSFVWGAVFVAAVILEILTSALIAVWFIPGALLALVFALMYFPLWVQLFAFFIASLGILFRIAFRDSLFRGRGRRHSGRDRQKQGRGRRSD